MFGTASSRARLQQQLCLLAEDLTQLLRFDIALPQRHGGPNSPFMSARFGSRFEAVVDNMEAVCSALGVSVEAVLAGIDEGDGACRDATPSRQTMESTFGCIDEPFDMMSAATSGLVPSFAGSRSMTPLTHRLASFGGATSVVLSAKSDDQSPGISWSSACHLPPMAPRLAPLIYLTRSNDSVLQSQSLECSADCGGDADASVVALVSTPRSDSIGPVIDIVGPTSGSASPLSDFSSYAPPVRRHTLVPGATPPTGCEEASTSLGPTSLVSGGEHHVVGGLRRRSSLSEGNVSLLDATFSAPAWEVAVPTAPSPDLTPPASALFPVVPLVAPKAGGQPRSAAALNQLLGSLNAVPV